MKDKKSEPEFIVKNGKPTAVIINIDDYLEMLERLEDIEDIKALDEARKGQLSFRTLDDFLKDSRKAV